MAVVRGAGLAVAAWVAMLPSSEGHAYLAYPPMRGGISGSDRNSWCPQCGNGAGTCGDGGQWGNSDFLGSPESPKATFQAGQIVEFEIRMTAHHRGHFEFSICDQQVTHSTQDAQGCLDRHRLRRASPPSDCVPNDSRGDCQPVHEQYPERWYLPPNSGPHKMKFVIPEGLQCSACTLQWRWFTANSCVPAPDYGCYFDEMRAKGWNADSWCGVYCGTCSSALVQTNASSTVSRGCGEEFRNCADIAVLGGSGPSPTPTTSSPAPTTPSPVPTTTMTTTAAAATSSAPTTSTAAMPAPTPAPMPPTSATGTTTPAATTSSPSVTCVPVFDCGMHGWCDQQGFEAHCASMASSGCVTSLCKTVAPEPEPEAEPETEPEPEAEPEAEPEPEPETEPVPATTTAPSSCQPTLSPYSLYCEDQAAQGLCPAPYCEMRAVAAVQAKVHTRRHNFLGLFQTAGVLERAVKPHSTEL